MSKNSLQQALAAMLIGVAFGALGATQARATAPGYALGSPEQIALDRQTIRIFHSPAFQRQMRQSEKLLQDDPQSASADGRKSLGPAVDAIFFNALQVIADSDPDRPSVIWSGDAPHRWFGLDVPFASYGFNNPDNIYRIVPIDGASDYVVTGKWGAHRPAQVSFFLYDGLPGDGTGHIDTPIGGVTDETLQAGPDGTFAITIDSRSADGRPNHIQSRPNARLLIIRDTLSDWSSETPGAVMVKRVAGPARHKAMTDAEIDAGALSLAPKMIAFWLQVAKATYLRHPVNSVPAANARGGGWGFTVNGRFALADDEALVVTIDPVGAQYVGFQLADPWAIPLEFVHHLSSLTNGQVRANTDGSLTFVISPKDPGVYNWLDTENTHDGTFGIRWQKLPPGADASHAVRGAKVVKLAELRQGLAAGTSVVTPSERKAQLADRVRGWTRRLEP